MSGAPGARGVTGTVEAPRSAAVPDLVMNDGHRIPQLGFGVFQVDPDAVRDAVATAIGAGYRMIDTAAAYQNEEGVGQAVAEAPVARDDLVVVTKLWNDDQGYDATLAAFETSAAKLGLDRVDLYLIHWPRPRLDRYVDSWKAMLRLVDEGRIRSVGVSNFTPEQMDRLTAETGVRPVLNQVELHPGMAQDELRAHHAEHGVLTQAWSPLGRNQGLLEHPVITGIAGEHGVTPAQVVLRWHLQLGVVAIPRSVTPHRIAENLRITHFALDDDQMAAVHGISIGPVGPDPALFFDLS